MGVVADSKDTGVQDETWPTFYFVTRTTESTLLIPSSASPGSLMAAVRHEALAVDPKQSVSEVVTMEQAIQSSLLRQRFSMQVFSLLSAWQRSALTGSSKTRLSGVFPNWQFVSRRAPTAPPCTRAAVG